MAGKNTLDGNWANNPQQVYNSSGKDVQHHTAQFHPGIDYAIVTGGTKVEPGDGYVYHVFWNDTPTSTGPFNGQEIGSDSPLVIEGGPPAGLEVRYLFIAGGGGGGGQYPVPTTAPGPNYRRSSGGGGAGGLREGTFTLYPGTYKVLVGRGGRYGMLTSSYTSTTQYYGGTGGPSRMVAMDGENEAPNIFYFYTMGGGGGGYGSWIPGGLAYDGGSGGGAGVNPSPSSTGAGNAPSSNPITPPQGNPGGGAPSVYTSGGGGGGGYGGSGGYGGAPGLRATLADFPSDAIGPAVPATLQPHFVAAVTTAGYYAAGGSGGNSPTTNYAGQGGNSSRTPNYNSNVKWAVPGTGSGGGGANGGTPGAFIPSASNAGPGAPGIVVLRYPA